MVHSVTCIIIIISTIDQINKGCYLPVQVGGKRDELSPNVPGKHVQLINEVLPTIAVRSLGHNVQPIYTVNNHHIRLMVDEERSRSSGE
jgi:hypothetical protein